MPLARPRAYLAPLDSIYARKLAFDMRSQARARYTLVNSRSICSLREREGANERDSFAPRLGGRGSPAVHHFRRSLRRRKHHCRRQHHVAEQHIIARSAQLGPPRHIALPCLRHACISSPEDISSAKHKSRAEGAKSSIYLAPLDSIYARKLAFEMFAPRTRAARF